MSEIVRVLRILEYTGPREWVEMTMQKNAVPSNGAYQVDKDKCIRSAVIGQYPEILEAKGE